MMPSGDGDGMNVNKISLFMSGYWFAAGALFCFGTMLSIGAIVLFLLTPSDDCDKSRWNRCGLEVKTDNKTGVQYLVTPGGGIIQRVK